MQRRHLVTLVAVASCSACALKVPASSCTRAFAIRSAAVAAAGAVLPVSSTDPEAAKQTLALLKEARAQLEPCAGQISEGNWDGVRNVVKTAPLASAKNLVTRFIDEAGEAADDLVVPREDLVQALQFLDMSVYNNNFINEQNAQGSRGKGVQVDRDTPLRHLSETKAALDEIISFKLP